jgi:hypothetical protein
MIMDGAICWMVGIGFKVEVTANGNELDRPPPGDGFEIVTGTVPREAMSSARIVATA